MPDHFDHECCRDALWSWSSLVTLSLIRFLRDTSHGVREVVNLEDPAFEKRAAPPKRALALSVCHFCRCSSKDIVFVLLLDITQSDGTLLPCVENVLP